MTDRTLRSKVHRLRELLEEIDTLTAQADTIKDQIKAEMQARGVDELEAGSAVIRWKMVNSTRFDTKAFKEAHSRLYDRFAVHTETRRFTVSLTYKEWTQAFLDACNADMPIPVYQWSRLDFPTINLREFYKQGFTPERAAILAKAINRFTKPAYFDKRKAPYTIRLQSKV